MGCQALHNESHLPLTVIVVKETLRDIQLNSKSSIPYNLQQQTPPVMAGFVVGVRQLADYPLAISDRLNLAQQAEEDIHGLAPSFS